MSDDTKVGAERRTTFGKGAARRLRAAGKIPAVIYGHGTEPQHIALPAHEIGLLLRRSNAVLELDIEGTGQLVLVKDVQRDPVLQIIEHLDLIVITKGEKVQVEVPVHLEGETFPGTIPMIELQTLRLEVEATHIPEHVVIDVTGAEEGTQVHAKQIPLPKGAELLDDPDEIVVIVAIPRATAAADTEEAEGEGAEGEESAEAAE